MATIIIITNQAPKYDIMPLLKTRAKIIPVECYTEPRQASLSARSCHVEPMSTAPYSHSTATRQVLTRVKGRACMRLLSDTGTEGSRAFSPTPILCPQTRVYLQIREPFHVSSPPKMSIQKHPQYQCNSSAVSGCGPFQPAHPSPHEPPTFCPVLVIAIKSMSSENPVGNFLSSAPLRT